MSSNGVLPVPVALLQKGKENAASKGNSSKRSNQPRLKLVIRRLPPGLTQSEFESAIGLEWKLGSGKVDWYVYRAGKISRDVAKPSRPAKAYLHLTDDGHLATLSEKIRHTQFVDAKSSSRDASLLGPPSVEFAPYSRIPQNRRRKDARQGQIDQEPEFISFLESLTNPIQKPAAVDMDVPAAKEEKVTTTPLIQHLREKKAAAKDKQGSGKSSSKHSRPALRDGAKDKRSKTRDASGSSAEKGKRLTKADRVAAKQAIKVLNREKSAVSSSSASVGATSGSEKAASSTNASASERKRDRTLGPMSVAAKIQRDLGIISPAAARRVGKREKSTTDAASSSNAGASSTLKADIDSVKDATSASTTTPRSGKREPRTRDRRAAKATSAAENSDAMATDGSKPKVPTGPAILKKDQSPKPPTKAPEASKSYTNHFTSQPSTPTSVTAAESSSPSSTTVATAAADTSNSTQSTTAAPSGRRAFLKHANPSQGINEALLHAAMTPFGAVAAIEIDKRKGFAYVDFVEPEGLRTAVKAGKVEVGKGAVQVLEYRERGAAGAGAATAAATGGVTTAGIANNASASGNGAAGGSTGSGQSGGNKGSSGSGSHRGRGGGFKGRGRGRGAASGGGHVTGNTTAGSATASAPSAPSQG